MFLQRDATWGGTSSSTANPTDAYPRSAICSPLPRPQTEQEEQEALDIVFQRKLMELYELQDSGTFDGEGNEKPQVRLESA